MIHSSHIEPPISPRPSALSSDGPATVLRQGGERPAEPTGGLPEGSADSELQRRLFPSHSSHNFIAPFDPRGVRLDHFQIEQMIGRGGMGAVYRATDDRLDRVVALKVLSPTFSRDPATVERFRNEAKAAARLDHDNIARVYYSGVDRGLHFIAFEYVTGTNLRDLILREGRLAPAEAVNYALQIAAALRHTAANGVVHRDIKPSNIIITPSGRAKLVDLGLARKESQESRDLTVAGTTLGTFDYISPEQAKDPRTVDVRSDIYSLGCTVYHMLTGEPPYPDGNFVQKLLDRQDRSPPDPALKAPHVGPELSAIVQRMMAPQPRRRYRDADELLNDLMHVAGQLGLRGVHPEGLVWAHGSKLQKKRLWERHLGWMVTAALLLAAVFGIDYFSRVRRAAPNDDVERKQRAGAQSQPRKTPRAAVAAKTPEGVRKRKVPPENGGGKRGPITLDQLQPKHLLISSVGLLGWQGVASHIGSPDSDATAVVNNRGGTTPAPETADEPKRIAILTASGEPGKEFPNLWAACAAAQDGNVIELRFNGVRTSAGVPVVDKPLQVRRSITIRAAAGFHPVIRFAGAAVADSDPTTRMITVVADSSLSIVGVDFEMRVDDSLDADNETRWTLFSLQGSDRVRLRSVRVVVVNPKARLAAAFEISPKLGPDLARMKMMKKTGMAQRDRFEIKLEDSSVQGECDLLAAVNPRAGSLEFQNAAIVVGGSVLLVHANEAVEMIPEGDRIELKLEHTTALVGRSLINVTAENASAVFPIWTSSRNSLYGAIVETPLVSMAGGGQAADFRKLLKWEGEKNFYNRFGAMWLIEANDAVGQPPKLEFGDWREHWGKNQDARQDGVVWKTVWAGKDASRISVADLKLDDEASTMENPAATAATGGGAVGADLSRLPRSPAKEARP